MTILEVGKEDSRQLQNISNILASSKKIVMITGAGISTNCGIPDFRSEDGLYALIQSQHDRASRGQTHTTRSPSSEIRPSAPHNFLPSNVKGKDLFDSVLWKDPLSTSVFYKFTASLRRRIHEDIKQTSPAHRFIRTLRDSRKLVRCYTQNIDGLESREGLCVDLGRGKGNRARFTKRVMEKPRAPAQSIPNGDHDGGCEVVQLHGDLEVLRCNLCQKTCGWEGRGTESLFLDGKAPKCLSCAVSDQQRRDRGKRGTKVGTLRPNIVLYGEEHPSADVLGNITAHDLGLAPDLLLILGTSLHVHGLKILVKEFAKSVRARPGGRGNVIFVNLSKPSESMWKDVIDYWVSMDCDEWIGALRRHRPDLWQIQRELKLQVTKQDAEKLQTIVVDKQCAVNTEQEKENIHMVRQRDSRSQTPRLAPQRKKGSRPLQDTTHKTPRKSSAVACDTEPPCATFSVTASQQLPTPPPSGHRARFRAASKRAMSFDDESAAPSKRARTNLKIWEDEEITLEATNHTGCFDRRKNSGNEKTSWESANRKSL